jgi:Calcineurin-like phosphoesterase
MEEIVFAHLMDIHMGSRLKNRFYSGPFSGLNGHDLQLCSKLDFAFSKPIPTTEGLPNGCQFPVVVSGDLTRIGGEADFYIAHSYLMSSWVLDRQAGMRTGLNLAPGLVRTVPGNHDQWAGRGNWPQRSRNRAIFARDFRSTPWVDSLTTANGRLRLDLFGVDSSSGLKLPRNPTAAGAVSLRERTALTGLLQRSQPTAPDQHLIRAIICHHAFSNVNAPLTAPLKWEHVRKLVKIARQRGVSIVLTGHTHDFRHVRYPLGANPVKPWVYELRSAAALAGPAVAASQGFFLHRVSLVGDLPAPTWHYRKYQWNGMEFEPEPNLTKVF